MTKHTTISLLFTLLTIVSANPLPKPRPFKCAGETDRICETGFCYDALGFYEGEKNVGCAPPDMCKEVGCLMYNDVFTCCCANRFCNGKTESLMWSKFRRFKDNNNVWPTFFPRLHVRNVTTAPEQPASASEARLSPMKTTTSFPDKPTTFGTTVKKIEYVQPTTLPEYTTRTTQKQTEATTTTSKATTLKRVETTTVKATPQPTTTTTTTTTTKVVPTTKVEPKIVNPIEEDKDFDDEEEDDEFDLRTTRSNTNRPTTSPTTTRKATTKSRRPSSTHPTYVPATAAPVIPPKQREAHVQKAFPWYYVTIIGFIISCILFGIAVFFIRRYRIQKAAGNRRQSGDSAPNSSLDSSRVSDLGNLQANEHAREPIDPLLRNS